MFRIKALSTIVLFIASGMITVRAAFNPLAPYSKAPADTLSTQQPAAPLVFRGTSLAEALNLLAREADLDLMFDPSLAEGKEVFVTIPYAEPETMLRKLLEETGLDFYRLSSGMYVLTGSPRNTPRYLTLRGRVKDRASGETLPFAHVIIDRASSVAADASGRFTASRLLPGAYRLTVQHVGYKPAEKVVYLKGDRTKPVEIELDARPLTSEPIVVQGIRKRFSTLRPGSQEIHEPASGFSPAGSPDALRSVNGLLGVYFALPLSNLQLQGGAPGQQVIRLDGVPVYNPFSIGRFIGAFSPYAIDYISVHKAGFGAPAGSQIAGVVDLHQKTASAGEPFMLQSDPLSTNMRLQLSQKTGDKNLSLMAAWRTSIWDLYQQPALRDLLSRWDRLDPLLTNRILPHDGAIIRFEPLNHQSDIDFSDLHTVVKLEHSPLEKTRLSFYRGSNRIRTDLVSRSRIQGLDPLRYMYTDDRYRWTNYAGHLRHEMVAGPRMDLAFGLKGTVHRLDHQYAMADSDGLTASPGSTRQDTIRALQQQVEARPDIRDRNRISEAEAYLQADWSFSTRSRLNSGFTAHITDFSFRLSDAFYYPTVNRDRSWWLSAFMEHIYELGPRWQLTSGGRFTYIPGTERFYVEPRLALQLDDYDLAFADYLSLRLSGGIYRQFINEFEISSLGPSSLVPSLRFWLPADHTVNVPRAYHLAAEWLLQPGEDWQLNGGFYYKWQPEALLIDYLSLLRYGQNNYTPKLQQGEFILDTRSRTIGAGIGIQKRWLNHRLDTKINYQWQRVTFDYGSRFTPAVQPAPWNVPHQVGLSVDWNAVPSLTFSLRGQALYGRSWAYRRAYYDFLAQTSTAGDNAPAFTDPGSDRLPAFYQLDAGMQYSRRIHKISMQARLDLLNILDYTNRVHRYLSPTDLNDGQITYRPDNQVMPGITPVFSLRFQL